MRLLRLPEVLELAAAELKPNILTDYLFDLANAFSTFFEECPVLKAESPERRDSRLALCDLTGTDLEIWARSAWNRCRRTDVSRTAGCMNTMTGPNRPDGSTSIGCGASFMRRADLRLAAAMLARDRAGARRRGPVALEHG